MHNIIRILNLIFHINAVISCWIDDRYLNINFFLPAYFLYQKRWIASDPNLILDLTLMPSWENLAEIFKFCNGEITKEIWRIYQPSPIRLISTYLFLLEWFLIYLSFSNFLDFLSEKEINYSANFIYWENFSFNGNVISLCWVQKYIGNNMKSLISYKIWLM